MNPPKRCFPPPAAAPAAGSGRSRGAERDLLEQGLARLFGAGPGTELFLYAANGHGAWEAAITEFAADRLGAGGPVPPRFDAADGAEEDEDEDR